MNMSNTMHSEDTGPLLYISQWAKKIVMITVHLDANYIFAETMRNKTDGERIHAYQKLIDRIGVPSWDFASMSWITRY